MQTPVSTVFIDGGPDTDTLVFDLAGFSNSDKLALAAIIDAQYGDWSVVLNGGIHDWQNFEELLSLMDLSVPNEASTGESKLVLVQRTPLNSGNPEVPFAVFCSADGLGIEVWNINPDGSATEAIMISFADLSALGSASGLSNTVEWLGPQMVRISVPYFKAPGGLYSFAFDPALCLGG